MTERDRLLASGLLALVVSLLLSGFLLFGPPDSPEFSLMVIGVFAASAFVFSVSPILRGTTKQRALAVVFLVPTLVYLYILSRALMMTDAVTTSGPSRRTSQAPWQLQELTFTTEAYQKEVLRMLIEEADAVARAMEFPEELPITEEDVLGAYISPPLMADGSKALGNITTRHYTYYVSVDMKFSYLVKTGLEQDYPLLRAEYLWPMDRMDTNAAYQMATQFLAASSMDVGALNQDCSVEILAWTPGGIEGKWFIPVYWVVWRKGQNMAAFIELMLPKRSLRQFKVTESAYIVRRRLEVENIEALLSETSNPERTEGQ